MNPIKSDLNYWLNKYAVRPNQRLGQCFLISERALDKIVTAANVKPGDKILEIGPGTGILTEKLLGKSVSILAVEKDSRLVKILSEKFKNEIARGKLKLISADFLKLPFPKTLEKLGWKSGQYKVIANLPYQITSPTIERLLERNFLPTVVALTIQKEVAERLCANPGDLSSLAVLVQTCTQKCTLLAKFPSSYFFPSPKIDSALIKLEGLACPGGVKVKKLRQLIRAGFSQKRKKLKKNFQNVFSEKLIGNIWQKLNLPENIRAQELEVRKWLEITKEIEKE